MNNYLTRARMQLIVSVASATLTLTGTACTKTVAEVAREAHALADKGPQEDFTRTDDELISFLRKNKKALRALIDKSNDVERPSFFSQDKQFPTGTMSPSRQRAFLKEMRTIDPTLTIQWMSDETTRFDLVDRKSEKIQTRFAAGIYKGIVYVPSQLKGVALRPSTDGTTAFETIGRHVEGNWYLLYSRRKQEFLFLDDVRR